MTRLGRMLLTLTIRLRPGLTPAVDSEVGAESLAGGLAHEIDADHVRDLVMGAAEIPTDAESLDRGPDRVIVTIRHDGAAADRPEIETESADDQGRGRLLRVVIARRVRSAPRAIRLESVLLARPR